MTNNTDATRVCSLVGGTTDTQSVSLPTLLPESKGFFTMIYENRIYFYILVLIFILSYVGYYLYKRLFATKRELKNVDNFQQLHNDSQPSNIPEHLVIKHETERQALDDKLKSLEQQIMNKQQQEPHRQEPHRQEPHRQEPHRQEPHRQEPHRQEPHQDMQPNHSQQMIEHNVDYSNQNNRIQNDVNEPRNMEDVNVQQYDLTEGELNNIVKELED
jgi:hypothetical protein